MSNDLFDANNNSPVIDPNKDYSADLVGEGKKFKDMAALARGKVESDHFIESLKREASELRQELQQRAQLAEMIERLGKTPERQEYAPPQDKPADTVTKEVNLDELFEQKFRERETIAKRTENVRKAQTALQESLGADYVNILTSKAQELGVTKEWLNNLAAESPAAVLKLVGAENKSPRGSDLFTPPPSSHHTGFKPSTSVRDKAFYDKMKREDSVKYWAKETQVQMHKDAMDHPERFWSTNN